MLTSLGIPITEYHFFAYKTRQDYENGNYYYHRKIMLPGSAQDHAIGHRYKESLKYPEYCSSICKVFYVDQSNLNKLRNENEINYFKAISNSHILA